jgi:metal-responsive CopG/Arc/MetJ family transcriptional regulator
MAKVNRKKRIGRPPVGAVLIGVRVPPDELTELDSWISKQDDAPSRPEAIRRLVEIALSHHQPLVPSGKPHKGALRAEEMAKEGMRSHLTGVSGEERATRKARLLKVPGQKSRS